MIPIGFPTQVYMPYSEMKKPSKTPCFQGLFWLRGLATTETDI